MKSIGLWAVLALLVTVLCSGPTAAQNSGFVLNTRNATIARMPGGATYTEVRTRAGSFSTWKEPRYDNRGYGGGGYYAGGYGSYGAPPPGGFYSGVANRGAGGVWTSDGWYRAGAGEDTSRWFVDHNGILHKNGPPDWYIQQYGWPGQGFAGGPDRYREEPRYTDRYRDDRVPRREPRYDDRNRDDRRYEDDPYRRDTPPPSPPTRRDDLEPPLQR